MPSKAHRGGDGREGQAEEGEGEETRFARREIHVHLARGQGHPQERSRKPYQTENETHEMYPTGVGIEDSGDEESSKDDDEDEDEDAEDDEDDEDEEIREDMRARVENGYLPSIETHIILWKYGICKFPDDGNSSHT